MTLRHYVLVGAIAACAKMGEGSARDDSTFVATMARLHVIEQNHALTEAARDSARRQVLQEQGLTATELEERARRYARDAERASAIWTAISRKALMLTADSVAVEGGAAPQQIETR